MQTSWDYRNLNGIEMETGPLSGFIAIMAPGVAAVDGSYWDTGNSGPAARPNAIPLTKILFEQARKGVAVLRELMALAQHPASSVTTSTPDITEQIKKLAELRDQGIVTLQEFETKKAELLSRM